MSGESKGFFHMVDFIYDLIQSLSGIIPRNGFCHHWALFVIEICFEEAITRRRCFGRGGKIYSNGCRFADDLIRRVHNEDASLSLSYSVSSSLSSKCMPMWTSVVAMFRSFKNTQDKEPSSNTDEVIKIIVASNFITEAARRPAVLIIYLWWQESFFVHIVTIVRNAQTTVASSFRLHFRCVCFFGPMATASQW